MCALLLSGWGWSHSSQAAVMVVADPEDRYGTAPNIFTVDPFSSEVTANANEGLAADRRLRQTFKNPSAFNVGQINISFNVTGGAAVGSQNDTGMKLTFYEVDDVTASSWTPGAIVREITLQPGNMPDSNQVLRFDLTGGDVFPLPQRNSGTAGYGLEISTPNSLGSDGNPGTWIYTNVSGMDFFADGRYYSRSGGGTSTRDVGISLVASSEPTCDPGDVDCDMDVDDVDLGIIAANFRTNGGRELGDLTGNGFVDLDDFGQWKSNYAGPPLGASSFAFLTVPEPASILLLVTAIAALPIRRRMVPVARARSAIAG